MAAHLTQHEYKKPRILVAPLDWGLGHATRCIPLVKELIKQNCDIWLAGEGPQLSLLRSEFPGLNFLELEGYRIRYGRTRMGLWLNILRQLPKISKAIRQENRWLKKMLDEYRFDAIISDNRFGLYNLAVPCVFITHQLTIKSSFGKWTERLLQRWNYGWIDRFSECWVPDMKNENGLAGELSHPGIHPKTAVHYLGILSRFSELKLTETKDHLVIILSGPEPQRRILESRIIDQLAHYNGTASVIRGLPVSATIIPSTNMIKFYNHLPSEQLNEEIEKAEFVISRGGYSTIMDVARLKKKSILVPTPGQTEQEYLVKYLQQKQLAHTVDQKNFSLMKALQEARSFNYRFVSFSLSTELEKRVQQFVLALKS
jgi:UDP-N-acetylglucosamine transferase subunit ALG13